MALSEVVENSVPVRLIHPGVDVVASIAEFRDFLCEELHPLGRIAKDDGLINLQLGKECIQAVDLLPLLNEGVVLRHSLQRQLIHQVDLVGINGVLFLQKKRNRPEIKNLQFPVII